MIPDELKKVKPLTGKERLGAHRDSEYLGAEDIDPGTEPILTIKAVYYAQVTLQRGKEFKDVIVFEEESVPGLNKVRPLVVNATNRKTMRKLFGAATAEALVGKRIQLYLEHNVRDPSTGDKVDGIRIRSRIPTAPRSGPIVCAECGETVKGVGNYTAEDVARMNKARYGQEICAACSKKRATAAQSGETKTEE
jgi:hypothetical protein